MFNFQERGGGCGWGEGVVGGVRGCWERGGGGHNQSGIFLQFKQSVIKKTFMNIFINVAV